MGIPPTGPYALKGDPPIWNDYRRIAGRGGVEARASADREMAVLRGGRVAGSRLDHPDGGAVSVGQCAADGRVPYRVTFLECGGSTPLSFFFRCQSRKKESGVEPPHSKKEETIMQFRELGKTGLKLPVLSFGASSLGQEFRQVDLGEALQAVHAALDAGMNFIDTSPFYGRGMSEVLLGVALRGIPRDRYLLGTKLGRYDRAHFDFAARRVVESVDVSLQPHGCGVSRHLPVPRRRVRGHGPDRRGDAAGPA